MNTPKTEPAQPQENEATPDAPGSTSARRGDGVANQGSPAASVMKQFAKTGAERGEGATAQPPAKGTQR